MSAATTEPPKSLYGLIDVIICHANGINRFDVGKTNPRGIPQAPFVERVEDFVKSQDQVEMVLSKFQDMLQ